MPPPPPSGAAGRTHGPEPGSKGRLRTIALLLALLTGSLTWLLSSRRKFSPDVAQLLGKALKAESEGFGGQNLPEAVKYYIEALMEAEAKGISPLTDEYTGIQLKLAEMYEMLNHQDAASNVYLEICEAYLDAFQNDKLSAEARPHCIQRALRIALKLVHSSNEESLPEVTQNLMVLIKVAQFEVASQSPEAAHLLLGVGALDPKKDELKEATHMNKMGILAEVMRSSGQFDMWMPFRDELIAARDMLTTINLAVEKTDQALFDKQVTHLIMMASGCGIGEILLTRANLASMAYLKSEQLEVAAHFVEQGKANGENKLKVISPRGDPVSAEEIRPMSTWVLQKSEQAYQRILKIIQKLEPEVRRSKEVEEAQALCTYGLGVIAIKKGELDTANDLLREARTRAKGSGFDDLVVAADGELAKVNKQTLEDDFSSATLNKEADKKPTVAEIHDAIANEIPEDEEK